jgi:hypothetical protein
MFCSSGGHMSARWIRTSAMATLLGMSLPGQAATWIEDYVGQPEDYRLQRKGESVPVAIYVELMPRDKIEVLKQDGVLHLKRDDGTGEDVTHGKGYEVPACGKPPGVFSNLLKWAGKSLTGFRAEGVDKAVVQLRVKGPGKAPPITFELAPGNNARLTAGTRRLHLAWCGGLRPFRLRLLAAEGNDVMPDQQDIYLPDTSPWRFTTPAVRLTTGQYRLEISDGQWTAMIGVEVVPESELPPRPAELELIPDDEMRETIYALWLATQGDAWMLEAYQRAVELEGRHAPARTLMHGLERGIRPQPPVTSEPAPLELD